MALERAGKYFGNFEPFLQKKARLKPWKELEKYFSDFEPFLPKKARL